MQFKPSAVNGDQVLKIVKAAVYLGISTALAALITALTNDPDMLGIYTPIINVVLVTIKQIFTKE